MDVDIISTRDENRLERSLKMIYKRQPVILITEKSTTRSCVKDSSLEGFRVVRNSDPREVFSLVSLNRPDLIILDADMEGISGYELLKTLKSFHKTEKIPVVLVAEIHEDVEPCLALELGAIDFMIKPISEHLIIAKISNYIKIYHSMLELEERATSAKEMNPNTGLPGNKAINRYVTNSLKKNKNHVAIYADLDNFKSYNDKYGFGRGDEIIKLTGDVIREALGKIKSETFLGHIGGDDFVFVIDKEEVGRVTNYIIRRFDQRVVEFYKEEDRKRGFIISKDRKDQIQKFPIMTLSLAGVDLTEHDMNTRYEYIADICAEVKKYAKTFNNSCYYQDRRHKEQSKTFEMLYSSVI